MWLIPSTLTLIWIGGVLSLNPFVSTPHEWLILIDVWARYTLGIPAGIMAAIGFVQQQRAFREQGLTRFGRDMLWAAIAFGWYGIFGQILRNAVCCSLDHHQHRTFLEPVRNPGSTFFGQQWRQLPLVFIIRSLRSFEVERTRQMNELKEAQMREAQQRQQLQSDLLRQIVTAQETERPTHRPRTAR